MVERNSHRGRRAVICTTGPSIKLPSAIRRIKTLSRRRGAIVFGLKEAIPYLIEKGVKVDYSVSMDPGGDRQVARTPAVPGVTYCVASSCHPKLFDHLLAHQCTVKVFHSACGYNPSEYTPGMVVECGTLAAPQVTMVEGKVVLKTMDGFEFSPLVSLSLSEIDVYQRLFPCADTMEGGFTVTNRALALAKYMGCGKVTLAGADFGWREKGGSHYSDLVGVGDPHNSWMSDHGAVDGREWYTRPDQLASAVDVARKIKRGEVEVLGDSLAGALSKREDAFLDQVVQIR
jgi:hypothetical protein